MTKCVCQGWNHDRGKFFPWSLILCYEFWEKK